MFSGGLRLTDPIVVPNAFSEVQAHHEAADVGDGDQTFALHRVPGEAGRAEVQQSPADRDAGSLADHGQSFAAGDYQPLDRTGLHQGADVAGREQHRGPGRYGEEGAALRSLLQLLLVSGRVMGRGEQGKIDHAAHGLLASLGRQLLREDPHRGPQVSRGERAEPHAAKPRQAEAALHQQQDVHEVHERMACDLALRIPLSQRRFKRGCDPAMRTHRRDRLHRDQLGGPKGASVRAGAQLPGRRVSPVGGRVAVLERHGRASSPAADGWVVAM